MRSLSRQRPADMVTGLTFSMFSFRVKFRKFYEYAAVLRLDWYAPFLDTVFAGMCNSLVLRGYTLLVKF